jgi:acyl-CoA synthetase (AMP-forming)/AMP-acid ligase II
VPLNPAFNSPQVASALSHLTATHLIISTETNLPRKPPRSNISLLTDLVPNIAGPASIPSLESISVPSLQKIILVDNSQGRIDINTHVSKALRYEDVFSEGGSGDRGLQLDDDLDADEIVNIQFTSGTTSKPKAASLTHRNILNNGNSIGDRMLLTPEDIVCCPPPLFQ